MDSRQGLHGAWTKSFPVQGGKHYRFHALRRVEGAPLPRRSAVVKISWNDDHGGLVPTDHFVNPEYFGPGAKARREYPLDKETDDRGWTEVSDTYQAPANATTAVIELVFRWAPPGSRVRWNEVSWNQVDRPASRKVRLASVHFRPNSVERSPEANRKLYAR